MQSVKGPAIRFRLELLPRLHPSSSRRSAIGDRDAVLIASDSGEQDRLVEKPIDDVVVAGDSIVREAVARRTRD